MATLPASPCVNCGKIMDDATFVGEDRLPVPGDITICIHCLYVMTYDSDLKLAKISDERLAEMVETGHWQYVMRIRRGMRNNLNQRPLR